MLRFLEADIHDIPLIQRLADASWRDAYHGILAPLQIDYMLGQMYSTNEIAGQISASDYHYKILAAPEPVGFIGYQHHYEPSATKLHRIYLLPSAKGCGLGKLALSFVEKMAAESGDREIILNVNKNNTAKSFYEAFGFQVYDDGIFDIGNGYVMDDYLMRKVIATDIC